MTTDKKKRSKKARKSSKRKNSTSGNADSNAPESTPTPVASTRDFKQDLSEYLDGWSKRDYQGWKFNKILQTWALTNCFDKSKIDSTLFKRLCPYLLTVVGTARDRLVEDAQAVTTSETAKENEDEENNSNSDAKSIKRAIKVLKLLGTST
jgi:hypothetical protein